MLEVINLAATNYTLQKGFSATFVQKILKRWWKKHLSAWLQMILFAPRLLVFMSVLWWPIDEPLVHLSHVSCMHQEIYSGHKWDVIRDRT